MKPCLACGRPLDGVPADFGRQPVCHHFVDAKHAEKFFPLTLAQCAGCGAVQTPEPVPPAELAPHYDWISYNEPEAHLDAMVDMVRALPGVMAESRIGGLSYKEDSTLRRFRERGHAHTWRTDLAQDFGARHPHAGMETLQGCIDVASAGRVREKYGAADVLVARHILEHTHDTGRFLAGVRALVKPGGLLVFEVPDCARAFDLLDYTTLWEDHTLYFVEATFLGTLERHGLSVVRFERFQAPYENCLVAVVTPAEGVPVNRPDARELARERERAQAFARGLGPRKKQLREFLPPWRAKGKIALLGAGHLAAMYLNVLGLADLIDFVIDDHPQKRGRLMPGSRLPIVGSEALENGEVSLCLTSLGAESEKKFVRRHQAFAARGGVFASIFPTRCGEPVSFIADAISIS